jgi:hypothetical protein
MLHTIKSYDARGDIHNDKMSLNLSPDKAEVKSRKSFEKFPSGARDQLEPWPPISLGFHIRKNDRPLSLGLLQMRDEPIFYLTTRNTHRDRRP